MKTAPIFEITWACHENGWRAQDHFLVLFIENAAYVWYITIKGDDTMIIYYVRHGDPIYDPDSLTELGHKQAEAIVDRMVAINPDEIYASTSNRAILTAKPTCERLGTEPILLDFANEGHAWADLSVGKYWLFQDKEKIDFLASEEIRSLGDKWYNHPKLLEYNFEKGIKRIDNAVDEWLLGLGYKHDRKNGRYEIVKPSDKKVALFAHQGFGLAFLSSVLDIPYPEFSIRFDTCHTGLTVIDFPNYGGFSIPKILTLSNEAHLYKNGVPLNYYENFSLK